MKIQAAWQATRRRWAHPGLWLGALVVPAFVSAPAILSMQGQLPEGTPMVTIMVVLGLQWILSVLFVSLPWQWSGDDRPQAEFVRGLFQWMALECLIMLVLALAPLGWLSGRAYGILIGTHVFWIMATHPFLGLISWLVARAETHELELAEAERQAVAAEQLTRRASFSPVVLFQSLEGLQKVEDARSLERGLVDLAVLFRTWLAHHEQSQVTFREERQLAERYLQVLDPGAIAVTTAWDPDADPRLIPPFGLSQLLEAILRGLPPGAITAMTLRSRTLPGGLALTLDLDGAVAPLLLSLPQDPAWAWLLNRLGPWGLPEPQMTLQDEGRRLLLELHLAEVPA